MKIVGWAVEVKWKRRRVGLGLQIKIKQANMKLMHGEGISNQLIIKASIDFGRCSRQWHREVDSVTNSGRTATLEAELFTPKTLIGLDSFKYRFAELHGPLQARGRLSRHPKNYSMLSTSSSTPTLSAAAESLARSRSPYLGQLIPPLLLFPL